MGVVSRASIVDGKRTRAGDRLIGLPSSGLHSNGFSLARKALLERGGLDPSAPADFAEGTVAEALLEPTRIYARAVAAALAAAPIHAMSHITGGGLPGNLPRVLPEGLGVRLDPRCWSRPPVFDRIASLGGVSEEEMYRTFNMGLGFVFATPAASAETLLEALRAAGEAPVDIGEVLEADADSRVRIGA
ncbi:MAG: AIR synthase-related protein [Myxococcales bacterium]|nr:AIR synthase-related protein [Myxococcales bacterium]